MGELGSALEEFQQEDAERRAAANEPPSGLMKIRPPEPDHWNYRDGRKGLYLTRGICRQVEAEIQRTGLSFSEVIRRAWAKVHGPPSDETPPVTRIKRPLHGEGPVRLSTYLPLSVLREIDLEAMRQQRPLSWIVRRAWEVARDEIRRESDRFEAGERRAQE